MSENSAVFSLSNFVGTIAANGVAFTDRYEVTITPPNCIKANSLYNRSNLAGLMADHCAIPGLTINNKRLQIYGASYPRPMTMDYGGEGTMISFILDSDMWLKGMFDFWIESIIDGNNALVAYPDDPYNGYTCTINIKQLDRSDAVVYNCQIDGAYPFIMMPIDKNNAAQGGIDRLTVGFAYRKWSNLHLPGAGVNATQPALDGAIQITQFNQ